MKVLDFSDVIQMHIDKFWVEPDFSGINAGNKDFDYIGAILDAIDAGIPYAEEDVEDGVHT